MKIKYFLLCLVLSVVLPGCGHDSQDASSNPADGDGIKQKFSDAVNSTKDYAAQSKDEFLATMSKKMKDLDGKIDDLTKKSAGYKDDAKAQADKALAELRQQRDVLGRKFDDLKKSGQDTWDKARAGMASAWSEVEKAYNNAKAKFN